ncbi:hypothetical protein L198_00522 [Cryptococcus wingfieldii CBS 7118]|uniref:Uncharacterized protein n=1 Tax=Cryptococcus wingfieldii CBS 7118 TaxID=1295528 RepID=A0A1E3K6S7_9TREE|nr:hypothetical protein L198_00522 [Cryptococcus wingfieldii CBS 7118]ODO08789.1 hypothetical protein L198_00522 [Cryptococcus wingfieldii CBS 7118]
MSRPSPHAPTSTRSASSPPVGRSPIGRDTTNAESHLHPSDHLAAIDQGLNDTRVPPPIYLRGSSAGGISNKGEIKIHLSQWYGYVQTTMRPSSSDYRRKAQVRPPRPFDNLSDQGIISPPSEDTVVQGSLEIIMNEGVRAKAISVGVQSVCRLYLGLDRGWEEDGIFERGIEILGDREEGIWLEKGSQSFSFTIVLPGTLAVTANSTFGRVTHIVTARVEGGEAASYFSSFISKAFSPPSIPSKISNIGDFDRVIARSDELALRRSRSASTSRAVPNNGPAMDGRTSRDSEDSGQGSTIVTAEGSPSVLGLYTRRPSFESSPARSPRRLPITPDGECPSPVFSPLNGEKSGWMKGDLTSHDGLIVFAVSPYTGDGMTLDVRKEGLVDGLGLWRFTAGADVFTVGSVLMLSVSISSPSPKTTIFYTRFLLSEDYTITSPRTPNLPATRPESAQRHLLYQLGRPHKPGEKRPGRDVDALWRGAGVGGCPEEAGWKIKAMARAPGHMKIKPTTHERTITPLRISHDLIFQIYYSVDGEKVDGEPIDGPGELRVMQIKVPVIMSSCHCVKDALSLPTYETAQCAHRGDGPFFDIPMDLKMYCVCRSSFAELGEAAMRRSQGNEREEHEERPVEGSGDKAREDMANQGSN